MNTLASQKYRQDTEALTFDLLTAYGGDVGTEASSTPALIVRLFKHDREPNA